MVVSVSLVKKLRKQPGKRIANAISGSTRSQCDGKLSGGLAPLLGAPRLGTLKAVYMPKAAVRPLRSSSCRFPHASPVLTNRAGKQKTVSKGRPKQRISLRKFWSGRRDSNPRPQPWQGCALPLSYARTPDQGAVSRRLPHRLQGSDHTVISLPTQPLDVGHVERHGPPEPAATLVWRRRRNIYASTD